MQRVLGIDLGTTNSVVAYVRRGEPEIVPNRRNEESTSSVIARGRRGELLVGALARGREGADEANVIRSIKRFMGRKFASADVQAVLERMPYEVVEGDEGEIDVRFAGREYTPTQISSLILGRLKAEAEDRTGVEFPRAVITVPAYFGERQVAATREAGRMAGFHVLKVLDEPTAAALAYGYIRETPEDDQTILVFDMGGGTFDISVLLLVGGMFTVLCVEGDNLLGGDNFDRLVIDGVAAAVRAEQGVDLAADRRALYPLLDAAEQAKIALSAEQDAEIILVGVGTPPVTVEHELSRADFTELIRPGIDRAMSLVAKAVQGADLVPADIDQVLLVGGSTAIPYVEECLAALFGAERIRKDVHPMKSVALGAAIQGSLVVEVECPHCFAPSPVSADDCGACGRSLHPPAKIACPACFLYADVGTVTCPTCGAALDAAVVPPPAVRVPATRVVPADPTEGGLRCLTCGVVNVAGASACAACEMPIEPPVEITAQNLGIELNDGRMAVIMPKNTTFPTPVDRPIGRDFATAVTDQRRLEIVVYEGSDEDVAQSNELCGYLTLALPAGLPRNSPINVSFGLDASRMITVSVRVRALGEQPRRVQIQHSGRLDPEDLQRLEAKRRSLTKFVDRWTNELYPAESSVCFQMISELDEMIGGTGASRVAVNEITDRAERLVETVAEVRGDDAFIGAVQFAVGRYVDESDRTELGGYSESIEQARERADWSAARVIGQQAQEFVAQFGPAMNNLVYCRTFAVQGKLSPALSHRVLGVVREFDAAFDRSDQTAMDRAMDELTAISSDVHDEVNSRDHDVVAVTKPQLGGG